MQTMADLDDADGPIALRTPLYLILATVGLLIFVAVFLPWAGVPSASGSGDATTVTGLDAGGWGLGAMIAGLAMLVLGAVGYVWNPFSDPEAAFIALFGAVTTAAAFVKVLDPASLLPAASEFSGAEVGTRVGLWVVLIGGLVSLVGGLWILYSRPKAQARLVVG